MATFKYAIPGGNYEFYSNQITQYAYYAYITIWTNDYKTFKYYVSGFTGAGDARKISHDDINNGYSYIVLNYKYHINSYYTFKTSSNDKTVKTLNTISNEILSKVKALTTQGINKHTQAVADAKAKAEQAEKNAKGVISKEDVNTTKKETKQVVKSTTNKTDKSKTSTALENHTTAQSNTNNTSSVSTGTTDALPKNGTDLQVKVEPAGTVGNTVVVDYMGPSDKGDFHLNNTNDTVKQTGIEFPLIMLNTQILTKLNIKYFALNCTDASPELTLIVDDYNGNLTFNDVPGMNNVITVIMTMPVDGVYRKISMDFYIINCYISKTTGSYRKTGYYTGIFKWPTLTSFQTASITKTGDDKKETVYLSTYEMCEEVAKKCGLGFQASPGCEDINDKNIRNANCQPLIGYTYHKNGQLENSTTRVGLLDEHVAFGGLDENSIFDLWVDLWGYINLVNVSWIFDANISSENLTIKTMAGSSKYTGAGVPAVTTVETQRMLFNSFETTMPTNMEFAGDHTEHLRNYKNVSFEGETTQAVIYNANSGNNALDKEDQEAIGNSNDDEVTEQYQYSTSKYLGAEMSSKTPTVLQKSRHDKKLAKLRSKRMKIELPRANFGLVRGTLVSVLYKEYATNRKAQLLKNAPNGITKDRIVMNNSAGVPNASITGLYYIDGIRYEYSIKEDNIKQILFLIKKDRDFNLIEKTNIMPHLDATLNSIKES